ncbi:valine--tRNA ligase [Candidatus Parcubacteria bacterium]|nr:valine--tRNA ligase [Patescibacteria group bacterium]MBU4466788.1 valine--tRNA ligase [Patescibacteria group bacterium]MCG2688809.1 valine--tRNA ligase [Candidatus Parcubacteria bacterium]
MTLPKTYDHNKVEDKISSLWNKGGFFKGKVIKNKKPFVITLPPPNVTGNLHAGHAMYVIEDIMARQQRMAGKSVLWLPGFDHASIAVEYLVSKQIRKEGKNKKEVGRQEFLKRAKIFAASSRKNIKNQLQKLGFSLDWSREAYTMDKTRSKAVKAAFHSLYKKGLIYQGEYIVNWCPGCQTAISDLENEYKEQTDELYYIKYGPFVLATTRPETKFGDTAVAVHPDDKRYQDWIGKEFIYESLTGPRKMKVVADKAVDPDFGTGAIKVTPGHDQTDFEIGQRHNLKIIKVIDERGRLTEAAGRFAGLSVSEARKAVVEELKAKGDLVKIIPITHKVGHCQRCNHIIEPLVSKQWFVKTKPLAKKAIEAVKSGKIKIVPKRFEKVYFHWLKNIRDWCISRQLWWGHKIPLKGVDDTLDTWFSASLWPISVFGWPQNTNDLKYFYPTNVRETGYDILFFWVIREIMMCLEMTGKVPFKTVYLHGLVRDEQGRKFSKTAGIGFDPLDMTAKYGTDALRISLVYGNAPGADLKIGEDKIRAMRNFTNKIWNAFRFVLMDSKLKISGQKPKAINKHDRAILNDLDKTIKKTNELFEKHAYGQAAELLYQFFWKRFCDQYIESTKNRKEQAQPILLYVLLTSLKLLHPFMPFVTEEIYQKLPVKDKKKSLSIENWPRRSDLC